MLCIKFLFSNPIIPHHTAKCNSFPYFSHERGKRTVVVPKICPGSWYDSTKTQKNRKREKPCEKVCKKGLTKSRIFCIILVIYCISMQNYAQKVNK